MAKKMVLIPKLSNTANLCVPTGQRGVLPNSENIPKSEARSVTSDEHTTVLPGWTHWIYKKKHVSNHVPCRACGCKMTRWGISSPRANSNQRLGERICSRTIHTVLTILTTVSTESVLNIPCFGFPGRSFSTSAAAFKHLTTCDIWDQLFKKAQTKKALRYHPQVQKWWCCLLHPSLAKCLSKQWQNIVEDSIVTC